MNFFHALHTSCAGKTVRIRALQVTSIFSFLTRRTSFEEKQNKSTLDAQRLRKLAGSDCFVNRFYLWRPAAERRTRHCCRWSYDSGKWTNLQTCHQRAHQYQEHGKAQERCVELGPSAACQSSRRAPSSIAPELLVNAKWVERLLNIPATGVRVYHAASSEGNSSHCRNFSLRLEASNRALNAWVLKTLTNRLWIWRMMSETPRLLDLASQ